VDTPAPLLRIAEHILDNGAYDLVGNVELNDYPAKRREMHLGEKQQVMQSKCMKSFR
jgi:hypothetical protein